MRAQLGEPDPGAGPAHHGVHRGDPHRPVRWHDPQEHLTPPLVTAPGGQIGDQRVADVDRQRQRVPPPPLERTSSSPRRQSMSSTSNATSSPTRSPSRAITVTMAKSRAPTKVERSKLASSTSAAPGATRRGKARHPTPGQPRCRLRQRRGDQAGGVEPAQQGAHPADDRVHRARPAALGDPGHEPGHVGGGQRPDPRRISVAGQRQEQPRRPRVDRDRRRPQPPLDAPGSPGSRPAAHRPASSARDGGGTTPCARRNSSTSRNERPVSDRPRPSR